MADPFPPTPGLTSAVKRVVSGIDAAQQGAEPVKIMIVMDDGFIGGVYTAGVPVDFVIVNYEIDQKDRESARLVDGVPAYVDGGHAVTDGPGTLAALEAWER